MKLTTYTVATILAYALAQAGALPSPQDAGTVASDTPAASTEEPMYYADEADLDKRDGPVQHKNWQIDGKARPFVGHNWKGMNQGNHGPMPDDDDLTPYLDHPDPTVAAMASIVRRAPEPGFTKINGINYIQAPKSHWWESQSNGDGLNPVVGGNPNIRSYFNVKEEVRLPKGLGKRGAAEDGHRGGPPAGFGHAMGGQGQGQGGHDGPPAGFGKGDGQGQHAGGPPGGIEHGQGGQPWKNHGGEGFRGHGPMADEE
ncbi:hypothetical protein A1O7_01183 [Cladophialophora yegresii CBS 114405]|uniref:Uncharacterized protein n=1 Tax=Cladophialophora yegresii CBS 114405 TaxID=1182544 RepID=W9WIR4_9EURO|nr:uncharacterized protein A1O7_01183 [Cladophialophora yegresii CBS 114405]EXJ64845.1 hypothetical protein A1O7_01183 [Cladophialophora yegresii CBS 114405]